MKKNKKDKRTDIDKHIGGKLKLLRKSKKMSMRTLSELLTLSNPNHCYLLESGSITFSAQRIYEICSIFNVTPNYLFPYIK